MQVPNGGQQVYVGGMALWTNVSNQDALVALWTSIANRYKNEPTILGYDLVNEPCPVRLDSETTDQAMNKWKDLVTRIATGINSVDNNHILFVEDVDRIMDQNGNDEGVPSRLYVYRSSF